jgi:hypothetical protein
MAGLNKNWLAGVALRELTVISAIPFHVVLVAGGS